MTTQQSEQSQRSEQASQPARFREADEAAIHAVLAGLYQAWDDGDADGFVADYTEDASAILPGSYRSSREEIRRSMAGGFAGPLKGSTTINRVDQLRFLGADAAVVISETGVLFAGETEVPAERMVNATWVLERRDSGWLVAAYHNSPVQAG
ncbi:SgcJ/EcaC family oxidoreductase [Kitasatospora azatica]|uniref:SgcJ/EcaC family oxidoreductase n=1 Tax=Kitasatospora azatica TaxID=58347 RepID=UPI0009FFA67F|nr:SgcJ/EcaC family oxidoreductase [Kitasatospora azatica]